MEDLQTAIGRCNVETVRALLDSGTGIYGSETEVANALHDAVLSDHEEILELLISRRADVESGNIFGSRGLHIAAQNGSTATLVSLLKRQADIHSRDRWTATPLHVAAYSGRVSTAQLLLESLADPYIRLDYSGMSSLLLESFPGWASFDGMTPLQVAERRGQSQMVELLTEPPLVLTVRARPLQGGLGHQVSATTMSGREVAVIGWPASATAAGLGEALRAALQRASARPSRIVRFVLPGAGQGLLSEDANMSQLVTAAGSEAATLSTTDLESEREQLRREWLKVEEAQAALAKLSQMVEDEIEVLRRDQARVRTWRTLLRIREWTLLAVGAVVLIQMLKRRR